MARSYTGKDGAQKDFVKVFDSLTGKYNRWEVWRDMVWMIATGISNAVDKAHADERERIYMDIVNKYTESEMERFAQLFSMLTESMDEKVKRGDWGDFLGELFMNLELGNDLGGQFFTPYHLCLAMARVTVDAERVRNELDFHGYISCSDPACGAGATLIAAAETLKEMGVDYQQDVIFVGQDIDSTTALMCYIQLSLLGCSGYVIIGDTLREPATGDPLFGEGGDRCWYTPMWFANVWQYRRWAKIEADKFRAALAQIDGVQQICAPEQHEEAVPEPAKEEPEPQQTFLWSEMSPLESQIQAENAPLKQKKPRRVVKKAPEVLEGQMTITF